MERISRARARILLVLFLLLLGFYAYKIYDEQIIKTGGNTDNGADLYEGLWAGVSEGGTDNPWFIELMKQEWFRVLVQERWNEVKSETMKIPSTIISKAKANFNSFDRNFEKWPTFGDWINQQPPAIRELKSYTEHYNYYAKWMQHRIAWLNNYYNTEDFIQKGP